MTAFKNIRFVSLLLGIIAIHSICSAQTITSERFDTIPHAVAKKDLRKLLDSINSINIDFSIDSNYFEYINYYEYYEEGNLVRRLSISRYNDTLLETINFYPPNMGLDIFEPTIHRFSKLDSRNIKKKFEKLMEIDSQLPYGIWVQRHFSDYINPKEPLESLYLIIRKANQKIDLLVITTNNKNSISVQNSSSNFPPILLYKWKTLVSSF